MCGHVGAAVKAQNGFFHADAKAFEQLLYIDALRGEDSTGIGSFLNNGEMHVIKDACDAATFMYYKEYRDVFSELVSKGKVVIGHNRKKTSGKIDPRSSHPFLIDGAGGNPRYMFAHNGSITNDTSLLNNLEKNLDEAGIMAYTEPKTGVDSETLGTMICLANGDKDKLDTLLGKVYGAWACVWFDQEKERLYMLRNKERPLYLAETDTGLFWASEMAFLYAALPRNKIKIEKCEQIEEDTLYTIDVASLKVTKEKLSPKKVSPVVTHAPGNTGNKSGGTTKKSAGFRMSKNAFKRFNRKWTGVITSFTLEDYCDRVPNDGENSGWHVWGTKEGEFEVECMCRAFLPAMDEQTLHSIWLERSVFGRIEGMYQDQTTGLPVILFRSLAIQVKDVLHQEKEKHVHIH